MSVQQRNIETFYNVRSINYSIRKEKQQMQMQIVQVKLTSEVVRAEVVKVNHYTFWVKLPDGNVIKRHKSKHIMESPQ